MAGLLSMLEGGDLRSIGKANIVAKKVLLKPALLPSLLDCLKSPDPCVRMRAADALEKVGAENPAILQPAKAFLLQQALVATQQEIRWHLAQIFSYLSLSKGEAKRAAKWLFDWLETDESKIVQVSCLETLATLSSAEPALRSRVARKIRVMSSNGSPAVRARCRKLMKTRSLGEEA